MPLEVRPINKLTYKLRLTPQMRLAINLLQMPLVKLKEYIEKEAEENPLLDIEDVRLPSQSKEGATYAIDNEEKQNYRESLITKAATLQEHLLKQLKLLIDSNSDRKIGELIIGNIDDDGYLRCPVKDIAKSAKTILSSARGGSALGGKVEKILSSIQTFDPLGVGARDLRECLLLQLKAKEKDNTLPWQIIDKYLPYLEKKKFDYIAKRLSVKGESASGGKISVETIKDAVKEIAKLEPKPGRSFTAERTVSLIPDAILRRNKESYEVILNDWELPRLTLNDKYKQMLKQKDAPEDAKKYLRERLKAGRTLIDAVKKRKETIKKVIEEIVYIQKDCLDNGVANFKPMTLERIAKRIGKHKSTVSRTVTNKYIQTPHGVFELRYFLNSGVKQENGELLSSRTIKSKIMTLIAKENKEKPFSDQKITDLLKQDGISITRRTIAKYRKQLKILPSKSRRE